MNSNGIQYPLLMVSCFMGVKLAFRISRFRLTWHWMADLNHLDISKPYLWGAWKQKDRRRIKIHTVQAITRKGMESYWRMLSGEPPILVRFTRTIARNLKMVEPHSLNLPSLIWSGCQEFDLRTSDSYCRVAKYMEEHWLLAQARHSLGVQGLLWNKFMSMPRTSTRTWEIRMEWNHVAMFILHILDSEGVLKSNVVDLDPRYPLGDRQPEVWNSCILKTLMFVASK